MICLDGASEEELIKAFRETFRKMSTASQARELMRLDRIVHNKPILIAEPIFELDKRLKFQNVEHFTDWLKKNGYPNANPSNVYKAIRGERPTAYGYKLEFKEERQ